MANQSWFPIPDDSQFSLANIPFGIASQISSSGRMVVVAIGEHVLSVTRFAENGGFTKYDESNRKELEGTLASDCLNAFAALGRPVHCKVRKYVQDVFTKETPYPDLLRDNVRLQHLCLFTQEEVQMHLPMRIGDYTDFYAGRNHAYNVGVLFRGAENALQPNYLHLPVGYHGRASSIVVSGTPIRRPWGQILEDPGVKKPILSPCRKLDFEVELGAFICKENRMGELVSIGNAEEHIFGYVLVNDWSARDIQAWEYVPLGPFTAKNFGTTISAWVVLADALEPFMAAGLSNDQEVLDYLREGREANIPDIPLEVQITANSGAGSTISQMSSRNLLWSFSQMIAHHTITGCNMNVGDLLASGTISGSQLGSEGSLLEQSQNGKRMIDLEEEISRTFLEDGDTVNITGFCGELGGRVGFGDCRGKILPAVAR